VAELVGHHALQLVAGQVVKAALGDSDHGIARCVAGREGINAGGPISAPGSLLIARLVHSTTECLLQ
jgi:hypothetical protein